MSGQDMHSVNGQGRQCYQALLARDAHSSCSTAVVKALAAAIAYDPEEVEFHLYDYIEPEALDMLYRHSQESRNSEWKLTFSIDQFDVTIRHDGYIEINWKTEDNPGQI